MVSSGSLVVTMILRNEEVNILANLPLWAQFTTYFVFLVDHRTTDNTTGSIHSTLSYAGFAASRYVIKSYEFDGFGPARSLSLQIAYSSFPQANHVMIADPDWRPRLSTIDVSQLHDQADVFRFVVYDRNGVSRRKMDWMLTHKPSLKMKYKLHEVLDIGYYSVAVVPWIFDEIERVGSWHTAVGHGSSMTSRRYLFDLDLLQRDLVRYDHDPHIDYYLGVTYHAYTEFAWKEGNTLNQTSLAQSIHFLHKRLQSTYEDEFIEQRWAAMYLLGGIFTNMQIDLPRALHWFTLCRDYNPRQVDCSLILARIHIAMGRVQHAWDEVESALQQEMSERAMLNMLGTAECELPALAVKLLITRLAAANRQNVSGVGADGEGILLTVLVHWLSQHNCNSLPSTTELTEMRLATGLPLSLSADELVTSCNHPALHLLLKSKRYRLHPCTDLAMKLAQEERCLALTLHSSSLSPTEAGQWISPLRAFIGGAFILDEDIQLQRKLLFSTDSDPFRVLFAVYFYPAMVLHLLSTLYHHHHPQQQVFCQVVIAANDSLTIDSLKADIIACLGQAALQSVVFLPLSALVEDKKQQFDLIEFNGGLSMLDSDADCIVFLSQLQQLLRPETGLLAATAFMDNTLRRELKQLLVSRNTSRLLPFSLEARRSVVAFLTARGLTEALYDEELLLSLGAEPDVYHGQGMPVHQAKLLATPPSWRALSIAHAKSIAKEAGLTVYACWPRLVCNPFRQDEAEEEYVPVPPPLSTMAALGFDSTAFVEQFMPAFRFTLFLRATATATATATDTDEVVVMLHRLQRSTENSDDSLLVIDCSNGRLAILLSSTQKDKELQIVPAGLTVDLRSYLSSPVVIAALKKIIVSSNTSGSRLSHLFDANNNRQEMISVLIVFYQLHWISFAKETPPATQAAAIVNSSEKNDHDESMMSVENKRLLALGFPLSVVLDASNNKEHIKKAPFEDNRHETFITANEYPSGNSARNAVLLSELSEALRRHALAVPVGEQQGELVNNITSTPAPILYSTVVKPSSTSHRIDQRVQQKKLHKQQQEVSTTITILPSYRRAECSLKPDDDSTCQEKRPLRRRTASLKTVSITRLDVLSMQLKLLQETALVSRDDVRKWQQWHTEAANAMSATTVTGKQKLLQEILQAVPLNRRLFVYSSPIWSDTQQVEAMLKGDTSSKLITAMSHLQLQDGKADFAVLDQAINDRYLQALQSDLALSTIYFDATNGQCAISHRDDGLDELSGPRIILQELMRSMMTEEYQVEIVHMSAIAFATSGSGSQHLQSPLFEAARDEVVQLFWLDSGLSSQAGLRVFAAASSDCLTRQGTIIYPSYHPDFLSKQGSLYVNMSSNPCLGSQQEQEWIQAKANRLLLINSKRPAIIQQVLVAEEEDKLSSSSLSIALTAKVKITK